jgi:hypothetical protein
MKRLHDAERIREEKHEVREDRARELKEIEGRVRELAQRSEAEGRLEAAKQAEKQAQAAAQAVQEQEVVVASTVKIVGERQKACAEAKRAQDIADERVASLGAAIQAEEAEADKRAALAVSERENRVLGLKRKISEAEQQKKSAEEARVEQLKASQLEREITELQQHHADFQRQVEVGDLLVKKTAGERQLAEIEGLRINEATAAAALKEASGRAEQLKAALKAAEAQLEVQQKALAELQKGLDETPDEQQRSAQLQSTRTQLVQLDENERRCNEAVVWWNRAASKKAALSTLEQQVAEQKEQLQSLAAALAEDETQTAETRAALAEGENLLTARALLDARQRVLTLEQRHTAAEALRERVHEARETALSATQAAQSRRALSPQDLERFRSLSERREGPQTQEPVAVSFPLLEAAGVAVLAGALGFAAVGAIGGVDLPAFMIGAVMAALAFVTTPRFLRQRRKAGLDSGRAKRTSDAETLWHSVVEPTLGAAGVTDVDGLASYAEETENLRRKAEDATRSEHDLRDQLAVAQVSADALETATREASSLKAELAGSDFAALLERAAEAPEQANLHGRVRVARQRLDALETARRRAFEEQLQLKTLHQGRCDQVRELTEELADVAGKPKKGAEELSRELVEVAEQRSGLQEQIKRLEETTAASSEETERRLTEQRARCDEASGAAKAKSEEVVVAREAVAEAGAKLESAVESSKATPSADIEGQLVELGEALEALGGSGEQIADEDVTEAGIEQNRATLAELTQKLSGRRAVLEQVASRTKEWTEAHGDEPEQVVRDVMVVLAALNDERVGLQTEPEPNRGSQKKRPPSELPSQLVDAQKAAEQAAKKAISLNDAREAAEKEHEGLKAELRHLAASSAENSLEQATVAVTEATAALNELPDCDKVTDEEVSATRRRLKDAAADLRQAETQFNKLQGQLQQIGGNVLDERLANQEQVIERLRRTHSDLEEEYKGYKRLYDTLKDLDSNRASHLGRALSDPVTKKFASMAGGRYTSFRMDPSLKAEGIIAGGGLQALSRLSVGTREQLASLVRLAIAEHLETAVLLDDQLVHSDEQRLHWFSEELRRAADGIQIIVFTCRPSDYLTPTELRADNTAPVWGNGDVVALDLTRAIETYDLIAQPVRRSVSTEQIGE